MLPPLPKKNYTVVNSTVPTAKNIQGHLPRSLDWRESHAVTPPRNFPRDCRGSSYALSAADMMEAWLRIQGHELSKLSAKQFIDCQNLGCDSGDTGDALNNFHRDHIRLESDHDYPFNPQNQQTCRYDRSRGQIDVPQVNQVDADVKSIKEALQIGPVSAAVNSVDNEFYHYKHGIISNCKNDSPSLYVTLIGYASDDHKEYFIGKNNWGHHWGEQGFFKIEAKDQCGLMNKDYLY